jgi:phosphonate transport system substrate-binding protein
MKPAAFFKTLMLAGLVALTAACGGGDKAASSKQRVDGQEIRFGILRTESSDSLSTLWDPFLADMRKQTGLNIKEVYATDYASLVEAFKYKKLEAAWLSNKPGMEAQNRANVEVFARTMKAGGVAGYYAIIIVPASSPIKTLDDLLKCDKTLTFGMGDPNSTSAYLVPSLYVFAPRGINPDDCFKTVRTADHDTNAMGVVSKQLDAAATADSQIERMQQARPQDVKKVREIWRSPMIQNDPLLWRRDLDPDVKARLMMFFMSYGRIGPPEEVKRERDILKALQWDPFMPSSDAHLYFVRDLQARDDLQRAKNDKTLSPAERDAAMKAAQAKIDAVAKLQKEQPPL